ncbi:ABC transporter substrate-binding protein [Paenibacillus sp. YAF4_2]|uniref:ABC transporter substrate-binding protein n=1 Tax=Paenibacillus sp. YAF4_2 TaxID=3233085 RepID=UPI003F9B6BAC
MRKHSWNVIQKKKTFGAALILLSGLLVLALTGCSNSKDGSSSKNDSIVVATKGFAESDILANALKLLVDQDTDLKTSIKTLDNNLLWAAIDNGEVDTYVEYTGTALLNILKEQPIYDPQQAYESVVKLLKDRNKIDVLDPIGFNDTYAFVIRKETADKLGITNVSQLSEKSGELVFGTNAEFLKREDTWPLVEKVYNPKFKEQKTIQEAGLAYQAIGQGLIDVMVAYSTDSKIADKDLIALEDDKHVFVPYYAVPVVRESTLADHPELKDVLNKLKGSITDAEMQQLNGEVELKQRPALDVAKEWLTSKGLL